MAEENEVVQPVQSVQPAEIPTSTTSQESTPLQQSQEPVPQRKFWQKLQDIVNWPETAQVKGISPPKAEEPSEHKNQVTEKKEVNRKITRRRLMQLLAATALTPLLRKSQVSPEFTPFPNPNDGRLEIPTANPEKIIKEVLGVDPKEYGMDSLLQIPSVNGKYFIHLGQIHSVGDFASDRANTDQEEAQLNIERFLTDAKVPSVYVERESEDTITFLHEMRDLQVNTVSKIPNTYEGLMQLSRLNMDILNVVGVEYRQGFDEWSYIVSIKMEEIKKELKEKPDLFIPIEDEDEKAFAEVMGQQYKPKTAEELIQDMEMILKLYDTESINTRIGTAAKMFFDGKLQVYPAETSQENREAITAMTHLISLQHDLQKATSEEERTRLISEVEAAKSAVYKEVHTDRERTALELVKKNPAFKNENLSVIIYGAAHDFSEEVMQENKKDANNQRGLIYLTPNSMKER